MAVTTSPVRERSPLEQVRTFADHGDAVALIAGPEQLTYGELDQRIDAAVDRLGAGRRLVVLPMANEIEPVVWYLAALRAGHPVVLTDGRAATTAALVERYDPDVVLDRDATTGRWRPEARRVVADHLLHPDLALLLSTSGSTGSPKLVRLSRENISQNAASIAEYLGLGSDDRAMTSLPMHYCYGLSVLHSHLLVGASIVLTDNSVVDQCFWDTFRRTGATSFAGVPHTFDLLDRAGFASMSLPTLRTVTQAGGRLDPATVQRYAELGRRDGWDLFVMYGQTEATARMAYLPPELARTCPDAIGGPVPGGSFELEPVEGVDDGGELVYHGPNVMLGYAEGPDDLTLGATIDRLRTGDLARRGPDGLYEIVGRRSRFVKLAGLRVDLDRVAQVLTEHGVRATCTGDDDGLVIALAPDADVTAVRRLVVERFGLAPAVVTVHCFDELPRLANGKPDLVTVRQVARNSLASSPAAGGAIHQLFADVLDRDDVGDADTFVSLGGDSLSYVEMSIALEERLGHLPDAWHVTPVADLVPAAPGPRRAIRVETNVVVRAVAIVFILGNHTDLFLIGGGAHVLFAATGFNFARFQLEGSSLLRSTLRLVVPSVLWIGAVAALTDGFDLAHAALVHAWFGGEGRWAYWFIEALVQVLVLVGAVMAVPRIRRLERRFRFGFPGVALIGALAIRFDMIDFGEQRYPHFRSHEILWVFLLGWMAAQASTTGRRLLVTAATLVSVPGFFNGNLTRECVVAGGILALLWVPRIVLWRPAARVIGPIATSTLYIYLTHVQVHPLVSDRWPLLGVLASLAVGVTISAIAQPLLGRGEVLVRRVARRAHPAVRPTARPSSIR